MKTTKKVTMSWTQGSYKTWGEYLHQQRGGQSEGEKKNSGCRWIPSPSLKQHTLSQSHLLHYEKQKLGNIFNVEFRQSSKASGNLRVERQCDAA